MFHTLLAKLLVGWLLLVLLVATGYVAQACFYGMNQKSDVMYVGGIAGLALWGSAVLGIVKRAFKKERTNEDQTSSATRNTASESGSTGGLHDTDRSRNGGDRSGPVG